MKLLQLPPLNINAIAWHLWCTTLISNSIYCRVSPLEWLREYGNTLTGRWLYMSGPPMYIRSPAYAWCTVFIFACNELNMGAWPSRLASKERVIYWTLVCLTCDNLTTFSILPRNKETLIFYTQILNILVLILLVNVWYISVALCSWHLKYRYHNIKTISKYLWKQHYDITVISANFNTFLFYFYEAMVGWLVKWQV